MFPKLSEALIFLFLFLSRKKDKNYLKRLNNYKRLASAQKFIFLKFCAVAASCRERSRKNMTYILSNTRILKESKRLAFFGAGQALANCVLK